MFVFFRSLINEQFTKECEAFSEACDRALREYLDKRGEDEKEAVVARYRKEMDIIERCGYIPHFVLHRMILDYAVKEKSIAYEGLTGAYSFAAFLYGIGLADPVRCGYDPIWAFGYHGDRKPAFQICVSSAFLKKAVSFLESGFGRDNVVCLEENDQRLSELQDKNYPCVQLSVQPLPDMAEALYPGDGKDGKDRYGTILEKLRNPDAFRDGNGDLKADRGRLRKVLGEVFAGREELPVEECQFGSYKELLRYIALGLGSGVSDAYREAVGSAEVIGAEITGGIAGRFPYTRDDAYNYLASYLKADPAEAFRLAEDIRKGKGNIPSVQERLRNCGAEDWFRAVCGRIRYLIQEGRCVPIARLCCLLSEETQF